MIETYICAFLHEKIGGGGAYMDVDWKWRKSYITGLEVDTK